MNKEKARELLEKQKEQLRGNLKKYEEAEKNLNKRHDSADILGPKNDFEYQRMRKDIEDSGNDEK
jgi:hypothetical protein